MLPLRGIAGSEAHAPTDDVVVARVLSGETAAFEVLMRRYNQRVFRAARSVLRDDAEAEDVVQDAWVRAYTHLRQFMGRASVATWVIRIAIHEALARRRYRGRLTSAAERVDTVDRYVERRLELTAEQVPGAV